MDTTATDSDCGATQSHQSHWYRALWPMVPPWAPLAGDPRGNGRVVCLSWLQVKNATRSALWRPAPGAEDRYHPSRRTPHGPTWARYGQAGGIATPGDAT